MIEQMQVDFFSMQTYKVKQLDWKVSNICST